MSQETPSIKVCGCEVIDRPLEQLEREGWKQEYSFRIRDRDMVMEMVDKLKQKGKEVVVVPAPVSDRGAREDGVKYLYSRDRV
ncbi:hypothetical protein FJZ48_04565 [Candidatus Uhrbacteria bacterium]|nr:hypothetical protein [Candidatus Uhrbacteria bacterium]